MNMFRALLALMLIVLSIYTAIVIANHGINLLAVFFGGMMFLTIYLLIVSLRTKGDIRAMLLGAARADQR